MKYIENLLSDSEMGTVTAGMKKRKSYYYCMHCNNTQLNENAMKEHVKSCHAIDSPQKGTDYGYMN